MTGFSAPQATALREVESQQDGLRGGFLSRVIGRGPFPRSLPPNPAGTFRCTGLSGDYAVALTEDIKYRFGVLHSAYLVAP